MYFYTCIIILSTCYRESLIFIGVNGAEREVLSRCRRMSEHIEESGLPREIERERCGVCVCVCVCGGGGGGQQSKIDGKLMVDMDGLYIILKCVREFMLFIVEHTQ